MPGEIENRKSKIDNRPADSMRTILLRHGQTDWNRDRIFRGRADVPLNEVGCAEADAIGRALEGVRLDAVYASPLSRAVETARRASGRVPEAEEGFTDIHYGEWQGFPLEVVEKRYPETYQIWRSSPQRTRIPGGETLDEVRIRAMDALMRLSERHPEETTLIVSHRVVNKVLLCSVLGWDMSSFWRIRQDTCAINVFDCTPEAFVIHMVNDAGHLRTLQERLERIDF